MTEEQREKLEELISEFEQVVLLTEERYGFSKECIHNEVEKAYGSITNHLDFIQWEAALYNLRRAGKPFDISVSMDVDNDE